MNDTMVMLRLSVFFAAGGLASYLLGNDAFLVTSLLLIVGVGGAYLYTHRS
ncbi:hypothetical protein [Rhizobium ruizarguesonis]|uniref:hypothetical protein n=1 Tax=Rhizobium ruizarguesonis TaxID=2081791 RepID=UPI0013B86852|nr:hypothetical protein [Rhizobium ruizarguesonis]NEJ57512.1 hypothetical protein [Rhizobium ruizarguesonis]NEJ64929.1 hypothetical protein [Rhizobium ruizarguesonis]